MKQDAIRDALGALHEGCRKSILPVNKTSYRCAFLEQLINKSPSGEMLYSQLASACRNKKCEEVSELLKYPES